MLVCHCHAVADDAIKAEIAAGALSASELAERCGAGSRCGGCHAVIEELLDGAQSISSVAVRSLAAA
jgi:bacterioferritin-associated ferredoxin